MAETIYDRLWGHYFSTLMFMVNSGQGRYQGDLQLYNLATSLSYDPTTPHFSTFLSSQACNYVGTGRPLEDTASRTAGTTYTNPFEHAYESFLDRFDEDMINQTNTDPELVKSAKDKLSRSRLEYRNRMSRIDELFESYAQGRSISSDEYASEKRKWLKKNEYSQELFQLRTAVKRDLQRLGAVIRKGLDQNLRDLYIAREHFDDPHYQVGLPTLKTHEGDEGLYELFRRQWPAVDWDDFTNNDSDLEYEFNSESRTYHRVEEKWSVGIKRRWYSFSGGGSVNRRKLEERSSSSDIDVNITFSRIEEYPIYRSKWYSERLIQEAGEKYPEFWGATGYMPAIPSTLIVARGMRISVKTTDEISELFKAHISAGGGMSFGPFSLSGGRTSNATDSSYERTEEGFRIFDSPNIIRLLGARVRRFHWNDEDAKQYHDIGESNVDGKSLDSVENNIILDVQGNID